MKLSTQNIACSQRQTRAKERQTETERKRQREREKCTKSPHTFTAFTLPSLFV